MSTGGPSGIYQRLLETTGIVTAARLLGRYGNNISAINALIGQNPGLARSEAGALISMGAAARRAARYVQSLPPGDPGHVGPIPINRSLFGNEPEGRRYQYSMNVHAVEQGTGRVLYTFSYIFEEGRLQRREDLEREASALVAGALAFYAAPWEKIGKDTLFDFEFEVESVQRRY